MFVQGAEDYENIVCGGFHLRERDVLDEGRVHSTVRPVQSTFGMNISLVSTQKDREPTLDTSNTLIEDEGNRALQL